MVMTRRGSMLERQRSESILASRDETTIDVEPDIFGNSPSLIRPTPDIEELHFAGLVLVDGQSDVVHPMSVITIKDEPLGDEVRSAPTPLKLEIASNTTPDLASSASTAFNVELTSSPITVVKNEPIDFRSDDEEDEEARDTVGALRSIKPLPGRAKRESSAGSVVSVEDAKASIDDFMADREAFTADEDNKLRFWQSLCIEFRLVKVEGDLIPSFDQLTLGAHPISTAQSWSDNQNLPPIPSTCAEAQKLLKAKAHVNLVDYFVARKKPLAPGEERDYSDLLFPSRDAVVVYTRRHKKYADRGDVKEEWLQPLLKIMRQGVKQ